MADNQHLVDIVGQGGGDVIAKLRHAGFQLRRVRAPRGGGIGVVMHQVIGEKLAVFLFKPAQQRDAQPSAHCREGEPRRPMVRHHFKGAIGQQAKRHSQQRLHNQHPHRIKRRNNRPLAQAHQPPKRAGADVDPCGVQQLPIGRGD